MWGKKMKIRSKDITVLILVACIAGTTLFGVITPIAIYASMFFTGGSVIYLLVLSLMTNRTTPNGATNSVEERGQINNQAPPQRLINELVKYAKKQLEGGYDPNKVHQVIAERYDKDYGQGFAGFIMSHFEFEDVEEVKTKRK